MKMISKKAQGEIITTVLIILLVLAAIVIVWQVVNGTVKRGGDAVTDQSSCIGLAIELSNLTNTVIVKPNKPIAAYRVYVGGEQYGPDGPALNPFVTDDVQDTTKPLVAGKVISSAGKIGELWCDGLNTITA